MVKTDRQGEGDPMRWIKDPYTEPSFGIPVFAYYSKATQRLIHVKTIIGPKKKEGLFQVTRPTLSKQGRLYFYTFLG